MRWVGVVVAAVVLAAGTSPAMAATAVDFTFTGIVTFVSGADEPFGVDNTALIGLPFTETFSFNRSEQVLGGDLTINGITDYVPAQYSSNYYANAIQQGPGYDGTTAANFLSITTSNPEKSLSMQAFTSSPIGFGVAYSAATLAAADSCGYCGGDLYLVGDDIYLTPQSVTEFFGPVVSAAIPEPAIWAMLMVGIFGVGALMRLRRHAAQGVLSV